MISSPAEARILLNKWITESAFVCALTVTWDSHDGKPDMASGLVSRLLGKLSTDGSDVFSLFNDKDDFVVFSIKDCSFGYEGSYAIPDVIAKRIPKNWDAVLNLRYPSDAMILLFAVE
jgi:hypothetical protein